MERRRTREDLHRELQELLDASKATSQDAQQTSSDSRHQQPLLGVADDVHAGVSRRSSSEKRKTSSELRHELRVVQEQYGQPNHSSSTKSSPAMHSASPRDSSKGASPQRTAELGTWSPPAAAKYQVHAEVPDQKESCFPQWLPFRASHAALKKHPCIWITSLVVMLFLAAAGTAGVVAIAAEETRDKRIAAHGFAINTALAVERQLFQMFGPLLSLSAIIRYNPDFAAVNATFHKLAKELHDQMPARGDLMTLIVAPQGVQRLFHPKDGYCTPHSTQCPFSEAVNMNLLKIPDRRPTALEAVRSGVLTMQGPMKLMQGYFGIVGRQPTFVAPADANETWGAPDGPAYDCDDCYNATTKRRFWGFVNAVVNLDGLVNGSDSRVKDLTALHYLYKLYKETETGPLVIAVSNPPPHDPVTTEVSVQGGEWKLALSPEAGWVPGWRAPIISVVVLVSCLFGLLLGAILVSSRLQCWLQATINALNSEKQRMDVLLARQYNLISCVLQQEGDDSDKEQRPSLELRTLTKIEEIRREIGVTTGTTGVDGLEILELIDEGSYGKVFKGMWRGSVVAVKTMVLPANMSGAEKRERMAIMEAAISSAMNHPNIVQTYTYIIKPCSSSVGCTHSSESSSSVVELATNSFGAAEVPESSSAANVHNFEVSLVLEFCDWGSLRTALDAGAFFAEDNSLNYAAILDTAADIARAMMHLHKHQVLHSDLKVRNVLLKSDASGRGCVAKVADFGLAVRLETLTETHVSAFQGTLSHMAPEALLHGRISKAADMYSFGITLWELFTGGQAYQGIPRALVGHNVAVRGLRPTLPPFTAPDLRELIEHCWHQEPEKRPTFEYVLARLVAMRQALSIGRTPPLQPYKLRVREVAEKWSCNEQDVAVAAANGLMQMGSYYMSSNGDTYHTTIQPGASGDSNNSRHNHISSGYFKSTSRSLGTGSQLARISDTEFEELEEELEQQQQQQQQQTLDEAQPGDLATAATCQHEADSSSTAAPAGEKSQTSYHSHGNSVSGTLTEQVDQVLHHHQQQRTDIEQGHG